MLHKKIFLFFLTSMFLFAHQAYCQKKGDLTLSFSFGLLTKGGITLKYFFADRVGLELCAGAMPHIYNYGLYLNFYPQIKEERIYYLVGVGRFGGFSPLPFDSGDIFKTHPDTLFLRGADLTGITLGMGFEKLKEKRDENGKLFYNNYYGAVGPTYFFRKKTRYINKENEIIFREPDKKRGWSMFFEVGYGAFFK